MALSSLTEIGRRALVAYQTSLATTGQNIANAETKGYSRRDVTLAAAPAITTSRGQLGGGVDVAEIRRIRDGFIDQSLYQEQHLAGLYEEQRDALKQIEGIVNEPSEAGLNHALAQLFNSFQSLADDPENMGVRTTVLGAAQNVVSTLHRMDRQITGLQDQLFARAQDQVARINELTRQVADVNRAVAGIERVRGEASDERDRRDLLLDELARLTDIQTRELADGSVTVTAGETTLVAGDRATELRLHPPQVGADTRVQVVRVEDGRIAGLQSGAVQGLLALRDGVLRDYQRHLDDIAVQLAQEINRVHRDGYGLDGTAGRPFFSEGVTGAGDIDVAGVIAADVNAIAASLDGTRGDNRNAVALRDVEHAIVARDGTMTLAESYQALIGDLGARSRAAAGAAETQALVVSKLENDRAAVSGVSLDEEAAQLISQQRAYQAAARLVRTADEMTQTLLDMLG
jgi:flagellar hook-associated protein 1 FlgK